MLNFRTIPDLSRDLAHAAPDLLKGVDAVVGIPRSGVLAASILALHAQVPLGTVDEYCARIGPAGDVERVLLLDDTACGGGTMRRAFAKVSEARPDSTVITAAVYRAPGTGKGGVKRFVETLPTPRMFEWNIWRSVHLPSVAFDMDGVFCEDPRFVDDDGPKIEAHCSGARPLNLPSRPVAAIVTCRLERWRPQTEAWLKRYGVRYKRLHMMRYPSAQARRRAGGHARWKVNVYRESGAKLFVESSVAQARAIAKQSGRQVWCIQDRQVYGRKA